MDIRIHHRHEFMPATLAVLERLIIRLESVLHQGNQIMQTLQDLQSDVTAQGTVIDSTVTLLNGLSAQIADLKTNGTDPATAAKIDELAQKVESQTQALSAAVVANTPAA